MNYKAEDLNVFIEKYLNSFTKVLYEKDDHFLEGMKTRNLAHDDIRRYMFWEWTQGVGLFGIWKMYQESRDKRFLDIMTQYYERQYEIGFPAKNVNTTTPLLAMSFFGEDQKNIKYLDTCADWAEWIYTSFPRTEAGGFQHVTSDSWNDQELWDDTLFMTVLFLTNVGRIMGRQKYIDEAEYQFLLHMKYLADRETGLWYHGWSFLRHDNFAGAFWGRGNCWITAAIPEFLSMVNPSESVKRILIDTWRNQVDTLIKCQDPDGMWHTLLDDESSYEESSATCGIAYGILKGVSIGIGKEGYVESALKALEPIIGYTDDEGVVHQVSYGTPMGRESKNFYKEIELRSMPYGQALAMLFLMESKAYIKE